MAYFLYRLAAAVLYVVPARFSVFAGRLAGRAAGFFPSKKKRLVKRNLERISGEVPSDKQVRQTFVRYASYYVESAFLPKISPTAIEKKFEATGYEAIENSLKLKKGVILALPHMGSWEWAGAWLAQVKGCKVTAVSEPFSPPKLQEWVFRHRRKFGINVIFLNPNAGTQLVKILGENHVVCLLSDRYISGAGMDMEFFGETTMLPVGPATLSLRTGAPIVPVGIYTKNGINCAQINPALIPSRGEGLREDVKKLTKTLTKSLEDLIRISPNDWHLMSPNWPSDVA